MLFLTFKLWLGKQKTIESGRLTYIIKKLDTLKFGQNVFL